MYSCFHHTRLDCLTYYYTVRAEGFVFRSTPAPPTGLEPAYSRYAFNDRLEDGDDTGARYVANFLFSWDICA